MLDLLAGTLLLRPYVFVFLAVYLVSAMFHLGCKPAILFIPVGYLIAFTSEYLSINTGFPYGWYYYIDRTSSCELWVSGVPFFDSLSYVFLAYCSYAAAQKILKKSAPCGIKTTVLAALYMTALDVIIDPVALKGEKWFLGKIYGYRESGFHFGVPLSNYLGWFFTGCLMISALKYFVQLFPKGLTKIATRGETLGVILYISIALFNISVALWIKELGIAFSGASIFIMLLLCSFVYIRKFKLFSNESFEKG